MYQNLSQHFQKKNHKSIPESIRFGSCRFVPPSSQTSVYFRSKSHSVSLNQCLFVSFRFVDLHFFTLSLVRNKYHQLSIRNHKKRPTTDNKTTNNPQQFNHKCIKISPNTFKKQPQIDPRIDPSAKVDLGCPKWFQYKPKINLRAAQRAQNGTERHQQFMQNRC